MSSSPRVIVYTAVVGGYDSLPTIASAPSGIEFVALSDSDLSDDAVWRPVRVDRYWLDNKLTSGFLKTHPHLLFPWDSVSVWVDGNLRNLQLDEQFLASAVSHSPIATLPHRDRSTVREEADAVIEARLDLPWRVNHHLKNLAAIGFPDDRPLSATMFVVSDLGNPRARAMLDQWWRLILTGSRRDQLCFDAAAWLTGTHVDHLDIDWREPNVLFERVRHLSPKGRQVPHASSEMSASVPCSFDISSMPDGYPAAPFALEEIWDPATLDVLHALNDVVVMSGETLEGNYCHQHKAEISSQTPPDPRRSWKREFLRRVVGGCSSVLEVGFNAGHSAAIMLGGTGIEHLTAIDLGAHVYGPACADVMVRAYPGRFTVHWGDSRDLLTPTKLRAESFDLTHLDGGHGRDVFIHDLNWWLTTSKEGSLLLLDDAYAHPIREIAAEATEAGFIEPWFPGLPTSGENRAFIRTRMGVEQFPSEYSALGSR